MQHYFSIYVAFLHLIFAYFLEEAVGWQFYGECVVIGSPFGGICGNANQSGKWLGPDSVLAAGYNIALFGHLPALGCDVTQFWSSPFIFYK